MRPSEKAVDDKYKADGWYDFSSGWPDRAYARIKSGKLEIKFVEIKGSNDRVRPHQQLMHALLLSLGIEVEIEPASKKPKCPLLPFDVMLKALCLIEEKRGTAKE